jgi:hypothetical protein
VDTLAQIINPLIRGRRCDISGDIFAILGDTPAQLIHPLIRGLRCAILGGMNTKLFENEGGRSFAAHPSCAVPKKKGKKKLDKEIKGKNRKRTEASSKRTPLVWFLTTNPIKKRIQ